MTYPFYIWQSQYGWEISTLTNSNHIAGAFMFSWNAPTFNTEREAIEYVATNWVKP